MHVLKGITASGEMRTHILSNVQMEPLALLLAASLSVSVSNAQKVTTVNLKAWRKKLIDALLDTIVQRELVTGFHIHAQLVSTEIFQPQYLCRTAVCVSPVIFAMNWVWEIQKSVQRVSSVQLVQLFLNHVQVVSMVTRLG